MPTKALKNIAVALNHKETSPEQISMLTKLKERLELDSCTDR